MCPDGSRAESSDAASPRASKSRSRSAEPSASERRAADLRGLVPADCGGGGEILLERVDQVVEIHEDITMTSLLLPVKRQCAHPGK